MAPAAGEARRRALLDAAGLLRSGHDVVLGQYLARTEFIEQLAALADDEGARFVEVVLDVDLATLVARLGRRARHPDRAEHVVNNRLVGPADAPSLIASLHAVLLRRPGTHRIDATGPVSQTVDLVRAVVVGA
jgi:predicted kinase